MPVEKRSNLPKKGAAKKWSQRLKEIAKRRPPEDLVKKINEKREDKKIALPNQDKGLEL